MACPQLVWKGLSGCVYGLGGCGMACVCVTWAEWAWDGLGGCV